MSKIINTPPCPFCSGQSTSWINDSDNGDNYILCNTCSCRGPSCNFGDEEMAQDYWNKRHIYSLFTWIDSKIFKLQKSRKPNSLLKQVRAQLIELVGDPTPKEGSVGEELLERLQSISSCDHAKWKCCKCGSTTSIKTIQKMDQYKKLSDAWDEMRSSILDKRDHLSEAGLNSDHINAVLFTIDYCDPRRTKNV